jgi:hypothetical protein
MCDVGKDCPDVKDLMGVGDILGRLEKGNHDLAKKLQRIVNECADWCHSLIEREIAHASANNETDFDPAELIHAIAVAVLSTSAPNVAEISDAIIKAKHGARSDGSWSPGQPYYTEGRFLGAYAITSDVIRTLVNAINRHPDITAADDIFENYVSWLERTKTSVTWENWLWEGWTSERSRERNMIDLRATTLAADALLDIRSLWEYRLWQLCARRFTAVQPDTGLKDIDPVDLGAQHKHRLHRRLWKMARTAELDDDGRAEYSLVLHGPPGSSKTALAQALSKEMWRTLRHFEGGRPPRLLRITPADFTGHGEDRVDSEARSIFELLGHVRGVTIFFDEIDDLLHKRSVARTLQFMELIIPAMLNRLADLRKACPRQQICFLIATNYVENIEPALLREGRIDAVIPVVYPDVESRRAIVQKHLLKLDLLRNPGVDPLLVKSAHEYLQQHEEDIVKGTEFWPWMTIEKFCSEYSNPQLPQREQIPKRLTEYKNHISIPAYMSRLKSPRCQELVDEVVEYEFTHAATRNAFLANLNPTDNKPLDPETKELIELIENRGWYKWEEEGRAA